MSKVQTTIRVPERTEQYIQEFMRQTGANRSEVIRAMLAVATRRSGAVLSAIHDRQ